MEKLLGIYKSFWQDGNDFKDRTSRNDFWMAIWWNVIAYILIVGYIMMYKKREGAIFGIFVLVVYGLANILPLISIIARRYNDVGLSKYWLVITILMPIAFFIISGMVWRILATILCLTNLVILAMPKDAFDHRS